MKQQKEKKYDEWLLWQKKVIREDYVNVSNSTQKNIKRSERKSHSS